MKQIKTLSVCGVFAGLLLVGRTSWACTGGAFVAGDGGVVVGRTLEFGKPLDSVIAIWPAGSEFVGQTPSGNKGLKFTSKHGFLGATVATNYDMILDGINDQGLNVGLFYFPGYAQYAEPTPENVAKGLAPAQVAAWILGNCANVAETRERIGEIALLPVVIDLLGIVPDLHIKVQDAAGDCIVIEPRGGKLVVHDNPVRVVTNAPDFPWMLTNLNNYLNMSSAYPSAQKIGDLHFSPFKKIRDRAIIIIFRKIVADFSFWRHWCSQCPGEALSKLSALLSSERVHLFTTQKAGEPVPSVSFFPILENPSASKRRGAAPHQGSDVFLAASYP